MSGAAFIVAAALLWATLGPVARFLLRDGIDPLEIGFWRAAFASVLFAAHALASHQRPVAHRDLPAVTAFALIGVTVFYVAFFKAVETGGASMAAILLYTAPVWVAIAAALWLGERLTPGKAVAIALTLGGVVMVAGGSGSGSGSDGMTPGSAPAAAVLWGLLSGVAYAVYYIFGKRYFGRYDPAAIFAVAMPIGALALLPLVDFAHKSPTDWLLLAFIAAVPTYGAYLLYAAGLARVEATRAATIATLEPIAAAALAYAIWNESLRPIAYAGGLLVIAGVAVTTFGSDRGPQASPGDAGDGA